MEEMLIHWTGFKSIEDFFGIKISILAYMIKLSIPAGVVMVFIERNTGLNFELLVVFLLGSLFDIGLGVYVNVYLKNEKFDTTKLERGVFRLAIAPFILVLTMNLKSGFSKINIEQEYIKNILNYTTSSIHYGALFFVMLFVIVGVAENLESADVKFAKSFMNLLRRKQKTVTDKLTDNELH